MTAVKPTIDATYDASTARRTQPVALGQDPGADTLLAYAMLVSPNPLQVNGPGTITFMVSNPGRQLVTCTSIDVALPVGVNAKDLTPTAAGLDVHVPANWQSAVVGGMVTLTPMTPDAGTIGGTGLTFIIAAFTVNAQPGTCALAITENASSPSQPAQARDTSVAIPKFPTQFQVSDLQAYPLEVAAGGSTTLTWIGSADATTYTLDYQPANQGPPVSQAVSNTGPYPADKLTRTGSVTFTLIVKVAVAGQDQPLMVERQATVTVDTVSCSLTGAPLTVGVHGLTHLTWSSANATSCTLDPGDLTVPTNGELYVVVPVTRVFTLTAYGFGGSIAQQQLTVTVDPAIQPNIQGYSVVGAPGARGHDSEDDWSPVGGGPGGDGGDAKLTATLPPLDVRSSPARVMPVSLTGGAGGAGGSGGIDMEFSRGRPGGNGGRGGDAVLTATFDASAGAPAQYVVTVAAGVGGAPGQPGEGAYLGQRGRDGTASMTFGGVP